MSGTLLKKFQILLSFFGPEMYELFFENFLKIIFIYTNEIMNIDFNNGDGNYIKYVDAA